MKQKNDIQKNHNTIIIINKIKNYIFATKNAIK